MQQMLNLLSLLLSDFVKLVLFDLAVGPLGACGLIDGRGYNLGYVQSSPQMVEDGSISIVYQNGDRCGSTSFYSTRIIFQCDEHPVSITAPTFNLGFYLSFVIKLHPNMTGGGKHSCIASVRAA